MCLIDKYIWKTSPNKLWGRSTTPATSKQEFFVTLVSAVNYYHKEIFVDVAFVLDTPLKLVTIKIFKGENPNIMSKATKI